MQRRTDRKQTSSRLDQLRSKDVDRKNEELKHGQPIARA